MSNFETWWEREGQEFLYALNTTTDDDIKLVAEIAWKNGAYCAAPAARQALDALENAYENGFLTGITGLKTIDIITALREALAEQAEQKPVAWVDLTKEELHQIEMTCETSAECYRVIAKALKDRNYAATIQQAEQEPVAIGTEWKPCMKLPVVVHVREQREGESHVSTREGITPVKPDDLIMRGVAGEEYPIGRELFNKTYTFDTAAPVRTKDLTDVEWIDMGIEPAVARAVIAADREKNK